MPRTLRVLALALLVLAFSGGQAYAATYDFTVSPDPPNEDQVATFQFQGPMADVERIDWDLDRDGSFNDGEGTVAQRTYADPGQVTVRMRVREEEGGRPVTTKTITVNAAPSVDFGFAPASPLTGDPITFSEQVSDAEGDGVALEWSFGDGATATGSSPTHAYERAGTYQVTLTANDEHGALASKTVPVTVGERVAQATPLRRIRPFPVVRIAGVVLPDGARVSVLSVRAPLGARVTVRCRGRSCPDGVVARTSATRLLRFRKFERRLAAGTTLTVFVRQTGRIGKYTRFLIRAGKPPARVDRCLIPGRKRPVSCR